MISGINPPYHDRKVGRLIARSCLASNCANRQKAPGMPGVRTKPHFGDFGPRGCFFHFLHAKKHQNETPKSPNTKDFKQKIGKKSRRKGNETKYDGGELTGMISEWSVHV